jgi:hypothetical protein
MTFDYCGVTLASNIGLPELRRSSGGSAGITFVIVPGQPPEACREPLQCWELPDSTPWLTMRRDPDGYLLHFEGLATFRVTRDGRHVCCWPEPRTPGDTVRHLFLNQTMPLVFSLMARTVFHASAVQVGEGAIAFSGATGQGKSTLAGSFVQAGASLVRCSFVLDVADPVGLKLRFETLCRLAAGRYAGPVEHRDQPPYHTNPVPFPNTVRRPSCPVPWSPPCD